MHFVLVPKVKEQVEYTENIIMKVSSLLTSMEIQALIKATTTNISGKHVHSC